MNLKFIIVCTMAALVLSGCSSVKKFTGQNDSTVLPGERESILPEEQTKNPPKPIVGSQAKKPAGVSDLEAPCDPEIEVNCDAPADVPADVPADDGEVSGGGVFQDG